VIIGAGIAILGGLLILAANLPFLRNLGSLPGDIHIEGQGFTCIVPVVSMLLLSLLLTIIVNVVIRLINRP
jgi:hypothetical protein